MAEYVEIRIPLLQTYAGRRIEVVRADLNGDRTVLESSLTVPASPRQEKRRREARLTEYDHREIPLSVQYAPNNAVIAAQNALEWLGQPAHITANTIWSSDDPPGTVHQS